ncbi:MAG: thiamine-phosphate kinase [Thermoguttaceae bacterium]|nr:thiamine-phosphate kinase [Thermoguttaceae bacterium]
MNEESFVASLLGRLKDDAVLNRGLLVGPGDDAALLEPNRESVVVTTDLLSDEVDFLADQTAPELIGRKAIAVNLSDLAAMGARPAAVVVSVLLPRGRHGGIAAEKMVEGMLPILRAYRTALAGGDTNSWPGKLAVSVTAFGHVPAKKAFLRRGARPGDRILVTGALGGSIHRRQFTFCPRVPEALFLREKGVVRAAMDISDGLLLDLSRLANASGVGFRLDLERIPIHSDVDLFPPADKCSPLDHALGDGEDFELILAVSPDDAARLLAEQPLAPKKKSGRSAAKRGGASKSFICFCADQGFPPPEGVLLTDIGEFLPRERGFLQTDKAGNTEPLAKISGWEHHF